ncbi:MAG: DMT family transporter [Candidatus Competibacteraceae bacterium]|nr:DMT family transporter [Candidatus Competibacteraceae bacterium]
MQNQTKAYCYAGATVCLWGTVASAFKLSLNHLTPAQLLCYAAWASLGVLLAIALGSGSLPRMARWGRQEWSRSLIMGLLNPTAYYLVLFEAYHRLPAQEAQPLNFSWPVVLVLLSWLFLGQRIRLLGLVALLVSFTGVVIIATRGQGFALTDPLGVGLALGSTLLWAGYWILGIKDPREPVLGLTANFMVGALLTSLWLLAVEGWRIPPLPGLAGALYVGLFEMGVTFVFWLQALRLSRTTAQVSNLIYLTPFLSLVVIHLVVGEPIYPSTLVGLALIVGGILLQQYAARREEPGAG